MSRKHTRHNKYSNKAGMAPGALVHVGEVHTDLVKITVIDYNNDTITEKVCNHVKDTFEYKHSNSVTWINIDGLHDVETIQAIGEHFGIHPLLVEDILNTKHRPKVEEFQDYMFFTLKMLEVQEGEELFISEQVSFVLGNGWVISFQEQEGDILDPIRNRLREHLGQIRSLGSDFLLYRLIDTVVDKYFVVSESIGALIDELEDEVIAKHDDKNMLRIQVLKKALTNLKRAILPLREATTSLQLKASDLITENTHVHIKDVNEHVVNLNDTVDSQREMLSGITDLYLSGVSNKMNEVMKVLTIIGSIFIPLTFIAGVYGMNFDNMPELHWEYGYFVVWGLMAVIFIGLIIYFRRRRWL